MLISDSTDFPLPSVWKLTPSWKELVFALNRRFIDSVCSGILLDSKVRLNLRATLLLIEVPPPSPFFSFPPLLGFRLC
ncbi:MAG: hypothetical protein ACKESB_00490 [Candidatus Hodgkinia cicadicola]